MLRGGSEDVIRAASLNVILPSAVAEVKASKRYNRRVDGEVRTTLCRCGATKGARSITCRACATAAHEREEARRARGAPSVGDSPFLGFAQTAPTTKRQGKLGEARPLPVVEHWTPSVPVVTAICLCGHGRKLHNGMDHRGVCLGCYAGSNHGQLPFCTQWRRRYADTKPVASLSVVR